MNIPYKYIVAVPANEQTTNEQLMLCLARQISEHFGTAGEIRMVATSEEDDNILKTAGLLKKGLEFCKKSPSLETCRVGIDSTSRKASDEDVRRIIQAALTPGSTAATLVIVTTLSAACKIPRIMLWDFLDEKSINPEIDMFLRKGEAGFVDCKRRNRDALHPEGYEAWAAKVLLGMV